ncbi:MAG: hypothetical protein VSS75_020980 [Candidatus Parabeggiatoa sp.]|nr:hypothetical protein [Candidatus Parabeggiatoa sp.]
MLIGNRSVRGAIVFCAFGLLSVLSSTCFATNEEAETCEAIPVPPNLQEMLQKNGTARVIVGLKVNMKADGTLLPEEVTEQQAKIARMQDLFLNGLKETLQIPLQEKKYATIPYVVIEVNEAALPHIIRNPIVTSIALDAVMAPSSGS